MLLHTVYDSFFFYACLCTCEAFHVQILDLISLKRQILMSFHVNMAHIT